jgi:transcriptional regulator with XRE-family HTH domain
MITAARHPASLREDEGARSDRPVPAARKLAGMALRRCREDRGMRLAEAARVLEWHASTLSRIETGQRGIRCLSLRHLMTAYGAGEDEITTLAALACPHGAHRWWREYADPLPPARRDLLSLEAAADQILICAPQHIPGLLRTPEYVRAVAGTASGSLTPQARDRLSEMSIARQQAILGKLQPELHVVIGAAALHEVAGDQDCWHGQLTRLAEMADGCPQATIQVLDGNVARSCNTLTILRFRTSPLSFAVHLPGPAGDLTLVDPCEVAGYIAAFAELRAAALSPAESSSALREIRGL